MAQQEPMGLQGTAGQVTADVPLRLLVTGTSSGIGRALAARLLDRGHHVWGLARRPHSAPSTPAQGGARFRSSVCDVSTWESVQGAARDIDAAWQGLDAVVACAGIQGEVGLALECDPIRWAQTVRANVEGTFNTLRAFAPMLARARRRGKIVCLSGGGATRARKRFSAYGVAKTAIVRLVETIAEEASGTPLDINAVAPGAVPTAMTSEILAIGADKAGAAEVDAARKAASDDGTALQRALDLIEFLISPASDGISGCLLSARWDDWMQLRSRGKQTAETGLFRLRRTTPGSPGQP